jgi:hypothetical protein
MTENDEHRFKQTVISRISGEVLSGSCEKIAIFRFQVRRDLAEPEGRLTGSSLWIEKRTSCWGSRCCARRWRLVALINQVSILR